jgi:hypothetical protein
VELGFGLGVGRHAHRARDVTGDEPTVRLSVRSLIVERIQAGYEAATGARRLADSIDAS